MSEFFNVTLNKDVVLDDSVTGLGTGWSSEKILNEIILYRTSKFEELSDVEVVNKKDGQVIVYSSCTKKFTTVDLQAIGEAAGISLKQISKMGVTGSPSSPYVVDIPISTIDFRVPKINILKFKMGDQDIIKTENTFTNNGSNEFEKDDSIVFDGTAHLKTQYQSIMTSEDKIESYQTYSVKVSKGDFKSINHLGIGSLGTEKTLDITAIPQDRLLIPSSDMNLSNASHIDYFNLAASSNVRVVCSVDGGVTWKTFNTDHWENINLTIEDVKLKGMEVSAFNSVNSTYWNLLVTTNKIRFAYLLIDNGYVDELKIQYDGQGSWLEAKDTEYDVVYTSNSLLQVKLYFSGDVKINY